MSVRLLVLSDTHLRRGTELPDEVLQMAERADHACHAGAWLELADGEVRAADLVHL